MEQQQVFDFAGWSGAVSPVHLDAPVATALIPLMAAAIAVVAEKGTDHNDEHESSLQQDHADAP